ncbi:MAG: recombinase family protein, partial [Hyphomicrobiales bacterium]|nr:recombinase family protein [Hyphomicrobiales bacterium]
MTKEPIKALIYCRVSSKSQEEEGHGLDSQETRCREYARIKGYIVEAVFPDTITGGGDFMKRPGMVALLSYLDAQPGENYVVIFDDLKRFARDTRFHLDLRDAFRARGASIACLNFKFDDTPEGEFIETIMAAQGALERKQNGRQVAQKMKARMQNGYWIHNAPAGYKYVAEKGRGKLLVRDEPMASIVIEGFEGYAAGRFETQAELKRFFETHPDFPRNKKGVVTQQRVTDILTNPLYTGFICSKTYGIDWLKGHHEALILLEVFDKVQARRKGVAKTPMRKNIGNDFILRGFVTCGCCDVPLRSSWAKGRSQRYPYYLCQTKSCDAYGKSIPRDKLEIEVGDIVKTLQPSQTLFDLVKVMFRQAWNQRLAQAEDALKSARHQIKVLEKQTESLLARIVETTNPSVINAYEGKIADLELNRIRLQQQMANRAIPTGTFEEKLEPALQFLANPWKLWETGQITLQRAVLKLAFKERLAYHQNEGARTPKTSLPFKALGGDFANRVCFGAPDRIRTCDLCLRSDRNFRFEPAILCEHLHLIEVLFVI